MYVYFAFSPKKGFLLLMTGFVIVDKICVLLLYDRHTVPRKNLRPVAPVTPQRPWSPVIGRGFRNLSGYYQKYTNGIIPDTGE